MIKIKRVYELPSRGDGLRVLVDRLWPRGLSKEEARVDEWRKELAPSSELRLWFNHEPEKWPDFKKWYFRELDQQPIAIEQLRQKSAKATVSLLYAAKDEKYNNAVALKEYLEKKAA